MEVIKLENIAYSYPGGVNVFEKLNFSLKKGERIGIVGANGSGKTTLFSLIMGLSFPQKGVVSLFERPCLDEKDFVRSRRKMGYLFQDPDDQLFMPTVFDDVAFGPLNFHLEDVENRVQNALHRVGLAGFEKRSSSHLSFGEKKRVAMATVLSMDPELLILDEPTSSLDPGGRRELIKMLEELALPKIIATHDLKLAARISDHVLLFHKGQVVLEGTPQEIISHEKTLHTYGL